MFRWLRIAAVLVLTVSVSAHADRTLLADDYLDKLRGMWLGQILGNYAGRATEGHFRIPGGNPADDVPFVFADPWQGDDDTSLEYLNMRVLEGNSSPSATDIAAAWQTHVPVPAFYIANRQARWLIDDGLVPPETGSLAYNMHWYAIDSQITTEALGAAAPGMRQRAADLAGEFGSVSNEGYALHAAQFYAAMYAGAAFESDVETLVEMGQQVVPATSRTHQIIQDVRDWYAQDQADGTLDWRATHVSIFNKYVGGGSNNRYRDWIESSVNTAMTTLAILYGGGDFEETVKIGVLAGFDCDCNPATAGGLIGLIDGYSNLPADLVAQASDAYHVETLQNLVTDTTIQGVAARWQQVAEGQILHAGGSMTGAGASRTYHLPDADPVAPLDERVDPTRPRGLVGAAIAMGGAVTTLASVDRHKWYNDLENLDQIVDGIVDESYNGHRPYRTDDGDNAQPAGGDFYQIDFDRDLTFAKVLFWEGDIDWNGINSDPTVSEPRGGYFQNLIVEVGDGGVWTPVANLQLSEPLDPFKYYQQIELTFDAVTGDAIRIRGDAGGTAEFTSIVELEVFGAIPGWLGGDATLDGVVDIEDLGVLANSYHDTDSSLTEGDFDMDGVVGILDLGILANNYQPSGGATAPEPASAALLAVSALAVGRRRRR